MNYLPGKFLDAIFKVRSGPCVDAHTQVALISQYHRRYTCFLPFLLAINTKCLHNFKFQAILKSKFKMDVVTDIRSNSSVPNVLWVKPLWVATF